MVEWLILNSGEEFLSTNPSKDLMDRLIERTRNSGHRLTPQEASSDPKMFRSYYYSSFFVTFEKAAKQAWQTVQSQGEITEAIKKYQPPIKAEAPKPLIKESHNNKEVIKPSEPLIDCSPPYTREKTIILLKFFYEKYGRLPTLSEYNIDYNLPSYTTVIKLLGHKKEWARLILTASSSEESVVSEPEEEIQPPPQDKNHFWHIFPTGVELDTTCNKNDDNSVDIKLVIYVPGRKDPVSINLTV